MARWSTGSLPYHPAHRKSDRSQTECLPTERPKGSQPQRPPAFCASLTGKGVIPTRTHMLVVLRLRKLRRTLKRLTPLHRGETPGRPTCVIVASSACFLPQRTGAMCRCNTLLLSTLLFFGIVVVLIWDSGAFSPDGKMWPCKSSNSSTKHTYFVGSATKLASETFSLVGPQRSSIFPSPYDP